MFLLGISVGLNASTRPLSRRIWPPPPPILVPPKIRRKINSAGRKSAGKKYSAAAEYFFGEFGGDDWIQWR